MKYCAFILLACVFLLGGCRTAAPLINQVLVRNDTAEIIDHVSVTHLPTREMASVSAILSGTELELNFKPGTVVSTHAVIQWTVRGVSHRAERIIPQWHPEHPERLFRLVYQILPRGDVRVFYREVAPQD